MHGASALNILKYGIKTHTYLFSQVTMSLRTWDDMQVQFHLTHLDHQMYYVLAYSLPPILHKIGIQPVKPLWNAWKWYLYTPLVH